MANGLRKLIRKAKKDFTKKSTLNRRFNKFGRLRAEELEERIAPAAVVLNPGDFTTYDVTGGGAGTHDATDGVFGVGDSAVASDNDLACTITDIDVTILDDTTPVITDIDFGGLTATETLVIATNRSIGDLDLGGLTTAFDTTTITTLNIVLIAGTNAANGAAANELTFDDAADVVASGSDFDYSFDTYTAGTGADPTDAETFTGLTTGSIGTITMPTSVHSSGLTVNVIAISGATGTITSITSTASNVTLSSNGTINTDGSVISGGAITTFNWAGPIQPGDNAATDIIIDADSNAGAGIGTLTLGAVALNNGDFIVQSDGGIGATTITSVTSNAGKTGDFTYDADQDGGNDDGVTGAVSIGAMDINGGAAAVTIDGGATGFASTVGVGAIDLAASVTGNFSITTSSTGGFGGLFTASTITNNSTNGAAITIGPAGAGDMSGFTATGLISTGAAAVNDAITIGGGTSSAIGALTLAGVTNASTNDGGDINFQGESFGAITSSAAIQATGTNGDILFNAAGATTAGSMGNLTVTGNIATAAAGGTVTFQANDDMGNIDVTGSVGGVGGAIAFTANNGGTANTGNIGTIEVNDATSTGAIGNGTGNVTFSAVDIGNITTDNIGTGTGDVTFTANGLNATNGAGGGVIGTIDVTNNVASGNGDVDVTFTADDGIGNVTIGGDVAQNNTAASLTFNTNNDNTDDAGSLGNVSAQTLGDSTTNAVVTINTNGTATDNTTERGVGTITMTDGNGKLSITTAGDVGLISVSGGNGPGGGNVLDIDLLNLNSAGDGTNADIPDLAGITITDTVGVADTLTLGGAWTIPGTMGPIVVGGSDATDVMALGANNINVYSGDDIADGFDTAYASTVDSNINITAGDITSGGGVITANTRAASNLLTYVKDGVTFAVTTASDVTAKVAFDPDGGNAAEESVAITELAGTSSSDDLVVSTTDASEFDVSAITPAVNGVLDVRNITIEGDLIGNIGTAALAFDAVQTIIIQGADGGNQFFGASLMGYASTDNNLVLTGVDVLTLDTAADGTEDLVLIFGSTFNFADAAGADNSVDQFNHHISVAGTAGTATIRGIDGAGDSTADALYTFTGNGASTAQAGATNAIDPNDLISGAAVISRIMISGITGLGTDVAVREVDGTTDGSWLEFDTSVGLVNLTTQLDSISVGIDDNSDLVDNAVSTSIAGSMNTRNDIDRLGGGQNSGNKTGLAPATSVSDATAALGNFVVQSMGASGVANNINIVVTGNCGPITLTGDTALATPDHGYLTVDAGATAAAIAIGGNLAGALTIPGQIVENAAGAADIMVGIAIDGNNDGDWLDAGETPSGSVNAAITIGDAVNTDILVADNVSADIAVIGQDQDIEISGNELNGSLNGVKAIGALNNDVIVAWGLEYVIADGVNAADIFAGGDGADTVEVEGLGITGAGVLGGVNGITSATFIDHAVVGDTGDTDVITKTAGTMAIQWAAGGITQSGTDTLGDVYMTGASTALTVTTPTGDAMNIGNMFQLDAQGATLTVTSPGDVGVLVVADDATVPSSDALQALINATPDVVMAPTALDTASGNEAADLSFNGSIVAENAGGIVAEGNVVTTAGGFNVDGAFGYIVALNGNIDASVGNVDAGTSIGHIVASTDIDGTFISEGTLAVGTATAMQTQIGTTFGLEGLPSWFAGGILSEAGDIGAGADEDATLATGSYELFMTGTLIVDVDGDGTYEPGQGDIVSTNEAVFKALGAGVAVGGNFGWYADAMGTFYAPAGSMSADINVGGSFGGIQVPSGVAQVELTVPMEATIDRLIAPQFVDNRDGNAANTTSETSRPTAVVEAISGETLVFPGRSYVNGDLEVALTGGGTIAIVADQAGTAAIDSILLVDGMPAGSALNVTGNVTWMKLRDEGLAATAAVNVEGQLVELLVDGDYNGSVTVTEGLLAAGNGEVGTLRVTGNIAATSDLTCQNYGMIEASAAALANVTTSGTFGANEGVHWTNMAGQDQTLAVVGGGAITVDYTRVFDKLVDVDVDGYGVANIFSVNGDLAPSSATDWTSIIDLYTIAGNVRAGIGDSNLSNDGLYATEGTAHVDDLHIGEGITTTALVVDGDASTVDAGRTLMGTWIGGDSGSLSVMGGGTLSQAFIRGDAGNISGANAVIGLRVGGNVGTLQSGLLLNSTVEGTTTNLNVDHHVIGNTFRGGVTAANIGGVSFWNSGLV